MAGAYSALISVMTVMDNLKLHPHPPISLHPQQAESLSQHLKFLEEFLESYDQSLPYSTEADPFESRIANAAYAAEDAIESHIVDRCESSNTDADFDIQQYKFLVKFLESCDQNLPYSTVEDPLESRIADAADAADDAIESHIVDRITSSGEGSSAAHAAEDAIESQGWFRRMFSILISCFVGFSNSLFPSFSLKNTLCGRHVDIDLFCHTPATDEADAAYAADDAIKSLGWFRRMCRRLGNRKKNTPTRDHLFCHSPPAPGEVIINAKATEETDAAYVAEDAIESHIADRIKGDGEDNISSDGSLYEAIQKTTSAPMTDPANGEGCSYSYDSSLYEALEKVIQQMELIQEEAKKIKQIMSGAYSAVVSVMALMDNLQIHPQPSISLQPKQAESLTKHLTFLEKFLQSYDQTLPYSTKADPFKSRIADAARAAQDAIESHMADRIKGNGDGSDASLYEALEKVIQQMESIQKEANIIKQNMVVGVQHQPMPMDSLRSSSAVEKRRMVGADHLLLRMKDNLVAYRGDRQVIPVVGMGGTGKTTLAMNIYQDRLIKEHFHIRAWASISQQYSVREILLQFLKELKLEHDNKSTEDALGEILYQYLFGKRYLIVMDDLWSIGAWDGIKRFLPNNENGSKIVMTTRLSYLASQLSNSNSLKMELLDETDSWVLLSEIVFGGQGCPLELEEIGKEIGKSCKGLPLSIVVTGGFLAKSSHTAEFWKYIKQNLSLIVNLEGYERCLDLLYMSYKQLPIYLKPCFLYMGIFPEDKVIKISTLVKLWVAEGFLKPISGESTLEDIARLYLKDLADRNLVLIDAMGITGNIKSCKIHDLLRDLCLREAEKERFYTLTRQGMVHGQRRIVINNTTSKNEVIEALPSMSPVRSLFWNLEGEGPPTPNLRLLRIFHSPLYGCTKMVESVHLLFNSRFLQFLGPPLSAFPLSIWKFWNLQTLIVAGFNPRGVNAPTDIWYMPHIRHVIFHHGIHLPDPPKDQDGIVLGNLQSLAGAINFSDQVVTRIPNLRKLKTDIAWGSLDKLTNLNHLEKLESLAYSFFLPSQINFPDSLKKLCLRSGYWEQEMLDKIGSLPFLHKLRLLYWRFEDRKWETTEDQFRSLKFLELHHFQDMQVWTTESSHFPCLSRLRLILIRDLKEFPLDLAEIPTLRLIEVEDCTDSAVVSLKRILEENEELYGEENLQVQIEFWGTKEEIHESKTTLEGLTGPNFHIEWKERARERHHFESSSRGTQENRVNRCCLERDFHQLMRLKFPG